MKKLFNKIFKPLLAIALSIFLPGAGGFFNGGFLATVVSGAVAGGVATGSLRGAFNGAFSAGLFFGVGALVPSKGLLKTAAYGAAGGISSVINGGKFGHGFVSAGLNQGMSGTIDRIQRALSHSVGRITSAAIVGGTMSTLTGGKFANGAITGAFTRILEDPKEWNPQDRAAALASDAVYDDYSGGLLKELGVDYAPTDGLQASLSKNDDGYLLTFRGSDEGVDWRDNARQGASLKTSQYEQAVKLAIAVDQATGGNVTMVGHSLGGGLAAAASYATGRPAVTFNAAGLSRRYRKGQPGAMRAHIIRGDILATSQNHPLLFIMPVTYGQRFYHAPIHRSTTPKNRHAMLHFLAL